MLEDINFISFADGDICITIKAHGGCQRHPISEAMASRLLRELADILEPRWAKQNREQHAQVIEAKKPPPGAVSSPGSVTISPPEETGNA